MAHRFNHNTFQGLARMSLALVFPLLAVAPALGQLPEPRVSDVNARSGLISRFAPIDPTLPPDPQRDGWYDTRTAAYPQVTHPNWFMHGGLYGLRWNNACARCEYPYFYGSLGTDTYKEDCKPCRPVFRTFQNLFQPWRPVGMYYDQGAYVPVYDLDPLVIGPGPNPWPWYYNLCKGGGWARCFGKTAGNADCDR
ncbi:MAG TPA: hypothetical protein VGY53_10395 [Isosphaeraceae bacterium]|nr:hypothetical protein [Isosphaeraceae bacterium]